tara:strand:- start:1577 stop:1876 length:300 start_codon:yes stop_codon:yes gene_type:complete
MGKVYLLVNANQGYDSPDFYSDVDYMLVGAYNTYQKAFETFLDIKVEEIKKSGGERERDPYLDNEILRIDQMHYEDVIHADQILTNWGWKIVEMKVERA